MLIQVATEAAKSSSSLALDGVAIMALITAGGLATREYFKSRRGRANGNNNGKGPKPGAAPKCIEHGEKLVKLETEHTNISGDIVEMKGDIKTLLQRIPPRE